MSEPRCPNCGGLVGADAEWCGQCFTRLREPAPAPAPVTAEPTPQPPAPAEPPVQATGAFQASDEGLTWICPSCEQKNPLEESECSRCGAEFRSLFEQEQRLPPEKAAGTATRSLLFPGLGFGAFGKRGEGVARGVTFAWMAGLAVTFILIRRGLGLGPFLPLVLLLGLGAVAVYAVTAVDARRMAEGREPVLSTRNLLFGSAGMMLVSVALILIIAIRARQGA